MCGLTTVWLRPMPCENVKKLHCVSQERKLNIALVKLGTVRYSIAYFFKGTNRA
jgi:hypothetical protein